MKRDWKRRIEHLEALHRSTTGVPLPAWVRCSCGTKFIMPVGFSRDKCPGCHKFCDLNPHGE